VGKEMHAHTRQTGRDLDDLRTQSNRPTAWRSVRAPLGPIELPLSPPPVERADTHGNGSLPLGDLVEEYAARARRVLMEQCPQQSLLDFTKLSPSTKRWTCTLIKVTLARGELHDFILLELHFRMQSAHPPLWGNGYFYPQ